MSRIARLSRILAWCAIGGLLALFGLYIYFLEQRMDLSIWHQTQLSEEFTAASEASTFADYLRIEARVFKQLDERIVNQVPVSKQQIINRYSRNSTSNPGRWRQNWNRSFELSSASPKAGVLLLHGMSDSPYSLHRMGETLNQNNAWVLGLRYPGHGTAPSGLTQLRWQDMARAVELAINHLQDQVGNAPIFIIGYSTGGALAVHYALQALEDVKKISLNGIVMIAPAIGITPLAALAVWQARLGSLPGLNKLKWNDIKLEYDPFKYNSFAVNAGDQVYRLTKDIKRLLAQHRLKGDLDDLPPILAFQSSVDATVSSQALVDDLFKQLIPAEHELMLFDLNRQADIELIFKQDPKPMLDSLLADSSLPFKLSILTNRDNTSPQTVIKQKPKQSLAIRQIETGLSWPRDIYSLSHVALPFSENDTLYGNSGAAGTMLSHLGDLALRGEYGTARIPANDMLRLRWNPFYIIMEQRILEFVQ